METILTFFQQHILRYNMLAAIGFAVAILCAVLLAIRYRTQWIRFAIIIVVSGAGLYIGAKLFGVLSYATYLIRDGHTDELITLPLLWECSGIVFYGGLMGFYLTLWLLIRRFMQRPRLAWDIVAVSTPLFHTFARIGCYYGRKKVNGVWIQSPCCYGMKMDNAFCAHFWDSRLPTQLIEATFNLLLFGVLLLLLLTDKRETRRGKLVMIYLLAYPIFRYCIEYFRDDAVRGGFGLLSFSQVVSVLIVLGVGVYALLSRAGKLKPLPPDPTDRQTEDRTDAATE